MRRPRLVAPLQQPPPILAERVILVPTAAEAGHGSPRSNDSVEMEAQRDGNASVGVVSSFYCGLVRFTGAEHSVYQRQCPVLRKPRIGAHVGVHARDAGRQTPGMRLRSERFPRTEQLLWESSVQLFEVVLHKQTAVQSRRTRRRRPLAKEACLAVYPVLQGQLEAWHRSLCAVHSVSQNRPQGYLPRTVVYRIGSRGCAVPCSSEGTRSSGRRV
mmetsp:Transcript_28188/g.50394  ORF Transcript_28188/g.50394 Transcript_28188/m.50394 type:complete len:215 (+) Transcript_28188:129-773(+)